MSRLQLDVRNLSLGRRHLVNAYKVKVGIGVIAGENVWSMPEHLECEVLLKECNIHILPLPLPIHLATLLSRCPSCQWCWLQWTYSNWWCGKLLEIHSFICLVNHTTSSPSIQCPEYAVKCVLKIYITYAGFCHFQLCSIMLQTVNICSAHDLPLWNPAWSRRIFNLFITCYRRLFQKQTSKRCPTQ